MLHRVSQTKENSFRIPSFVDITNTQVFLFSVKDHPHGVHQEARNKQLKSPLSLKSYDAAAETPLIFISTYNKVSPNIKEIIRKHWPTLGTSNTIRESHPGRFHGKSQ